MTTPNNPEYGRPDANAEFQRDPFAHDGARRGSDERLTTDQTVVGQNQPGKSDEAKRLASDAGDRAKDVAGTARDDAKQVADTAKQEASHVADAAKQEAGQVVETAKAQGKQLLDEGAAELRTQAGAGQSRIAGIVRSMTDELGEMTRNSSQNGIVTDLAKRASRLGDDAASFLENNEPDRVVDEVRRYAARNPWTFLAISAGIGFVASRFVKGLQSDDDQYGAQGNYRTQGVHRQVTAPHQQGYQAVAPSYSADQNRVSGQTQGYQDDAALGARNEHWAAGRPVQPQPGQVQPDQRGFVDDTRGGAMFNDDANRPEGLR